VTARVKKARKKNVKCDRWHGVRKRNRNRRRPSPIPPEIEKEQRAFEPPAAKQHKKKVAKIGAQEKKAGPATCVVAMG